MAVSRRRMRNVDEASENQNPSAWQDLSRLYQSVVPSTISEDTAIVGGEIDGPPPQTRTKVRPWLFMPRVGPERRHASDLEAQFQSASRADGIAAADVTLNPERCEIMQSWHNGSDAFYLNIIHGEGVVKKGEQGAYGPDTNVEWIHQTEDIKSQDSLKRLFRSYALQSSSYGTIRDVLGLLTGAQKHEEKQYAGRNFYLKPCALGYKTIYHQNKVSNREVSRPCIFINFPYFALTERKPTPMHTRNQSRNYRRYPVRTLHQTRYRLEPTEKKDVEQSITRLSVHEVNQSITPQDASIRTKRSDKHNCTEILHVPDAWCLMVGGDKLLTTSPMTLQNIYGNTMSTKASVLGSKSQSRPCSRQSTEGTSEGEWERKSQHDSLIDSLNDYPSILRIIFEHEGREKTYTFPLKSCDCWFGLVDKAMTIQCENQIPIESLNSFELHIRKKIRSDSVKVIDDSNWVDIIRAAKGASEVLEIWMKQRLSPEPDDLTFAQTDAPDTNIHSRHSEGRTRTTAIDFAALPKLTVESRLSIPFFEWPQRAQLNFEINDELVLGSRTERVQWVLKDLHANFNLKSSYIKNFRDQREQNGEELIRDEQTALDDLSTVKGISGDEFQPMLERQKKGIRSTEASGERSTDGHKDVREAQIDSFCEASRKLFGTFFPERVISDNVFPSTGNERSINSNCNVIRLKEGNEQAVEIYRRIVVGIAQLISSEEIDAEAFDAIQNKFVELQELADGLQRGVFTLRDSLLESLEMEWDDNGFATLQKAIMDAFKETMYLHLDIWFLLKVRQFSGKELTSSEVNSMLDKHYSSCTTKFIEAKKHLIDETGAQETPELGSLVTLETVVILLLDRLSQGVHKDGTLDVLDMFYKVVEKLALKVEAKASSRLLLRINKTAEELEIIAQVLRQQENVLLFTRALFDPQKFDEPSESTHRHRSGTSDLPPDRERQFKHENRAFRRILKRVRAQLTDCEELQERVANLTKQNVQLVDTKHEANNRAILVFTIVTIVFSPLSFFTGLFGMNLKDNFSESWTIGGFWILTGLITALVATPCLLLAFWVQLRRIFKK